MKKINPKEIIKGMVITFKGNQYEVDEVNSQYKGEEEDSWVVEFYDKEGQFIQWNQRYVGGCIIEY